MFKVRVDEADTNSCADILSDRSKTDNKENNVIKEEIASQILSEIDESDNENNTATLPFFFRAVNEWL